MPLILHLETATSVCSVCIARNGKLLGKAEQNIKNSHASALHVLVDSLMKDLEFSYDKLDAIAVSMGPGSYTGLRIGVSAAKGFCFSLNIPLIAINSLQAMTAHFLEIKTNKTAGLRYCPMIDARRMEVYLALFDEELNFLMPTSAVVLDNHSFSNQLKEGSICFFGDGSEKLLPLLKGQTYAQFEENFLTSSTGLINLALNAFNSQNFKDLAHFEPYYLKDFVAIPPNK